MEIARAQDKYLKLSRLFSNPKISTLQFKFFPAIKIRNIV